MILLSGCAKSKFAAYCDALTQRREEIDRYTPPPEVKPEHTVRVFRQGSDYFYLTAGLGFVPQPGDTHYVELATYSDRKDLRIAEILSMLGEAMHQKPAAGPWNAWSYDTISTQVPMYGLQTFVLRPGGEWSAGGHPVSLFTVIPIFPDEIDQVRNVGAEKARAWVEARAVGQPKEMLARWKLTAR